MHSFPNFIIGQFCWGPNFVTGVFPGNFVGKSCTLIFTILAHMSSHRHSRHTSCRPGIQCLLSNAHSMKVMKDSNG